MMGQLRLAPGEVKITYGTAAMLDLNAGPEPLLSMHGAYPLVLWQRDGVPHLLPRGHGDHRRRGRSPGCATASASSPTPRGERRRSPRRVPDSGGVWAVPAFQGLGTPYMDTGARARSSAVSRARRTRAHVVRAVLEGIAWRCREVYDALRADSPHPAPASLRADGGAARNDVLLQAQADALGLPVERPAVLEAAALGAAYLAGPRHRRLGRTRTSSRAPGGATACSSRACGDDEREERLARWQRHVAAARSTEDRS